MIENRVRSALQMEYEKRILVYDLEGFSSCCDYVSLLRSAGFSVYFYDDVERIRLLYETDFHAPFLVPSCPLPSLFFRLRTILKV